MTDDLGFEPLDDELGRRLRGAAGEPGDAGDTLTALRPRLERARVRRRHGIGAVVLAGALVGGIGFAAVLDRGGAGVRTPPATRPPATSTTLPVPTTTTPTLLPDPTAGTTPTSLDDDGGGGNSGPGGGGGSGSGGSGGGGSDDD